MLPRLNPIYVRKAQREILTQQPAPSNVRSVFKSVHNFPLHYTDARGIVKNARM